MYDAAWAVYMCSHHALPTVDAEAAALLANVFGDSTDDDSDEEGFQVSHPNADLF
jgi:hypothetical protein